LKTKKKNNTSHETQKNKREKKLPLAKTNIKLQNPGLVAFYDTQPTEWIYIMITGQ